jgi:hypothetical protein
MLSLLTVQPSGPRQRLRRVTHLAARRLNQKRDRAMLGAANLWRGRDLHPLLAATCEPRQ